jgi:hypothetical protein
VKTLVAVIAYNEEQNSRCGAGPARSWLRYNIVVVITDRAMARFGYV